jgi:glycosyltransferase involved in cell wall biosynthesis
MFQLPVVFFQMVGFIRRHDLLLIRAPGHFSLMAHILAVLLRKKSITKFAGFFGAYEGERLPSVVERFFMRNFLTSRNLVLVYGRHSKPNFISFFPLVMSESEMNWIDSLDRMAPADTIFRFVSLGRLLNVKGYDLAIKGLGELYRNCPEWLWNYYLVGDGPEEAFLRQLAKDLGIADRVIFVGRKNYQEAMILLKKAQVLIMPGVKEGWPKSVVEAWVIGAIPLCAMAGLLPEIIQHGKNGFLFEPDPKNLAAQCLRIKELTDGQRKIMATSNKKWVRQYSAESFKNRVAELCTMLISVVK